jgi:selenocysteine-specific elongation factor
MAREELRSRLGVAPPSFPAVVLALVEDGCVVERDGALALPDHRVDLEVKGGAAAELLDLLRQGRFTPPSLADAMQRTGAGLEMVRALAAAGSIVRLSDDVAFSKEAFDEAVAMVREIVVGTGTITVAQLRDRMGASRRPVLALLEYLDAQRVTRRVGDARVLR